MRLILFLCLFLYSGAFAELPTFPQTEGPHQIGYLYLGDHQEQISQGTWIYVKNALEHYKSVKPLFIILELDTPGGEVFAAQKISDALKTMDTAGIPVVAFINNWAMSAGAMLAYSCRTICIVKDASMGAAAPITGSGEPTSEKVNSAIRADFASRAAYFGRNPLIAKAMVDHDIILVRREGQIIELAKEADILPTDQMISPKGKLLTLDATQLMEYGVADLMVPPQKLESITAEERELGTWPASKMLLFTVSPFKELSDSQIIAFKMDWKTRFFTILSSSVVSSLILLGLILCFYIEMNTGGFGLAGSMGLVFLFLLLLSSFAMQAFNWLEVIVLILGIILILIELFVAPGFGFPGILGGILTLGALIALLLPGLNQVHFDFHSQTLNAAGEFLLERVAYLSGALVVGAIIIALLAKYVLPTYSLYSPLVLHGEQEGYSAGSDRADMPALGSAGVVVSPLRPAGKVEFAGELYDAMSQGSFIEKGAAVKIVLIEGSKIIVEELL